METTAPSLTTGSALPHPRSALVFKAVAEGAVVFSTVDETYFGLNEVAARIWELLPPACATFGDMCTVLAERYHDVSPQEIENDVRELLGELLGLGLVAFPPPSA